MQDNKPDIAGFCKASIYLSDKRKAVPEKLKTIVRHPIKTMGEYILYYRGRFFCGIYDDILLVKPVPVSVKLMPDAEMEPPYDGAKKMILVDDVDNRQFCVNWLRACGKNCRRRKRKSASKT